MKTVIVSRLFSAQTAGTPERPDCLVELQSEIRWWLASLIIRLFFSTWLQSRYVATFGRLSAPSLTARLYCLVGGSWDFIRYSRISAELPTAHQSKKYPNKTLILKTMFQNDQTDRNWNFGTATHSGDFRTLLYVWKTHSQNVENGLVPTAETNRNAAAISLSFATSEAACSSNNVPAMEPFFMPTISVFSTFLFLRTNSHC